MTAEHAIPTFAEPLFHIGPLPVTNSMVVAWIVALGLIAVVQAGTRKVQLLPGGLQNFLEFVVESLYSLLEGIVGPEFVRRFKCLNQLRLSAVHVYVIGIMCLESSG